MRLLTKTTLYFLIAMVLLLFAGGFFLYRQFNKEINHRMDEELITEEVQWIRYLQSEADNGATFILRTAEILIYPVNAPVTEYPTIEDSYAGKGKSKMLYRQLSHVVPVNGIPYQITIRRTQEQKVAMEANVTRIMLFVFAGLFAATLLFNWLISKRIWKPFRQSLQKIREAELQKMEAVHFENTNIIEFNELNTSLNAMANKIHADYVNMKEFTENAAHEMQTPLAVVQSKLELLIQDSNLNDNQVQAIVDSSTALNRLSKLNQSLLLLAKIENNQYETSELTSFTVVTKKYLKLFDELIKDKQLQVNAQFTEDFQKNLHPLLADSLVSNLIGNAIKYNYVDGNISIEVTADKYTISNTSTLPAIDESQLFKRFNKTNRHSDSSNGLGLAIVKKICDTQKLSIRYETPNGMHRFTIQKK
jgi:signal transduction histidine kinase